MAKKPLISKTEEEISFGQGIYFLLLLVVVSNIFESLFDQAILETFKSAWSIYIIGLLLVLIPIFVLLIKWRAVLHKWASSMNLAVLLILLITIATTLGTLVFQKRMPVEYIDAYGPTLFSIFNATHMIDIFHSVWFLNVLFVLIISIVYCYISRRELSLKYLGGYFLHFGIVISLLGAFIGFIYGLKGNIQLNEGDRVDNFIIWEADGSSRIPLGYEIILDDFEIEWYEPKYLINTFHVERHGSNLLSSLNVEKKNELSVSEADLSFEVLKFSENGVADGLAPTAHGQEKRASGNPPYPIIKVQVEDHSLRRMTGEEAKASGWLAAYDHHQNSFTSVFNTDARVLFTWQRPEEVTGLLEGKTEETSDRGGLGHTITYTIDGKAGELGVDVDKEYKLEGSPYRLKVSGYYASFKIDQGKPYSSSNEPTNPALSVEITDMDDPGKKVYGPLYLFAREEFRSMMHEGDLPPGLELVYEMSGAVSTGETTVYIVGQDSSVYVMNGTQLISRNALEFGIQVPFQAAGHQLMLSVQEMYLDQPLCELAVTEGGSSDTLLISPLFDNRIRHRSGLYVSVFHRERDILDYKSSVRVFEEDKEIMSWIIEVNHPLVFSGYSIYQQNYNEMDWTWTGFEVVRDPGLWIVYLGFIMMCAGCIWVFYVRPRIEKV
jgi:hypothetical protein